MNELAHARVIDEDVASVEDGRPPTLIRNLDRLKAFTILFKGSRSVALDRQLLIFVCLELLSKHFVVLFCFLYTCRMPTFASHYAEHATGGLEAKPRQRCRLSISQRQETPVHIRMLSKGGAQRETFPNMEEKRTCQVPSSSNSSSTDSWP